ncbi:MAG: TlyA family rRNA (cytidine-2'-O)-methyltransferase, partial [Proteobacteria bacterium]|nr:TlyA family rRNA (cytidine-2'-O)-methyltransferase [Pseudomonadota bacterium]
MSQAVTRHRLDNLLVARGLSATRSRARDLIRRGVVRVNGIFDDKPARMTRADSSLEIAGDASRYVSRGSEKLVAALDAFGFDPQGRHALDVGAS